VVEVQGDGNGRLVGHRANHLVQDPRADLLDGLQRRLEDHRRLQVGGRGEHRVDRQIVDDVDGGDAVALLEGRIQEVLE